MAVIIVHLLEKIQVGHDDGQRRSGPSGETNRFDKGLMNIFARSQTGQIIGRNQLADFRIGVFQCRLFFAQLTGQRRHFIIKLSHVRHRTQVRLNSILRHDHQLVLTFQQNAVMSGSVSFKRKAQHDVAIRIIVQVAQTQLPVSGKKLVDRNANRNLFQTGDPQKFVVAPCYAKFGITDNNEMFEISIVVFYQHLFRVIKILFHVRTPSP